jgi:hypothetical protein
MLTFSIFRIGSARMMFWILALSEPSGSSRAQRHLNVAHAVNLLQRALHPTDTTATGHAVNVESHGLHSDFSLRTVGVSFFVSRPMSKGVLQVKQQSGSLRLAGDGNQPASPLTVVVVIHRWRAGSMGLVADMVG